MPRSSPGVSAWLLLGAIGGVLGGPLVAPAAAQSSCTAGTFGAGAADSPRLPGRVLARLGGRFNCPGAAEWWFEYGPTPQYGQRTTSNDAALPVQETNQGTVVRTDVDGLEYGRTYHYRLVVRSADGSVAAGSDTFVRVRPGALRPPQRVGFSWTRRPTPARTVLDTVSVLDALPGSIITVSCTGLLCKPFERRIVVGKRPTVFRDWRFRAPGFLTVVVGGRGVGTVTTITPRPRSGPAIATQCGGFPVAMPTRCAAVSLNYRGPHVRRLLLTDIARGSTVRIVCRGAGCPRRDLRHFVATPRTYTNLAPRGFTRLRPGASLRVFVTRPQTYGLTVAFRVTRTTVERGSYRCLSRRVPLQPVACPSAQQVTTGRGTAAAAASAAHLPPLAAIRFRTVATGDGTSTSRPRQAIAIRSERRWRKVWDQLGEGEPPAINFAREMLIAVTQGPQPSGGHAIRIRRIQPTGGSVWRVSVSETEPGRGCPSTGVMTNPYHVVRVRRSSARVRFERRRDVRACR